MLDIKAFKKTKFKTRTESVPVPDLAAFFPPGEEPVWVVKGLTGQELGSTKEAAAKNRNFSAIIEALESTSMKEKTKGLKQAMGIGEVPQNIAERIAQLEVGSVEPKCDTEAALALCERYPVDFYNLTNKILQLTGQGMEPGKLNGSSQIPASEPV